MFLDDNADLVDSLESKHGIQTLEMETFVINHLAMAANVMAEKNASQKPGWGTSSENPNRIRVGAVQMMYVAACGVGNVQHACMHG